MVMSKANLTLSFKGDAVENGEIDVKDLAPALLALGEVIQAANAEINGNKTQMSVKVRATAKGSFVVDLALLQSMMENMKIFLDFAAENKDGISAAKDIAEILFGVGGGVVTLSGGFYYLLKFLKGRKPDKVERKDGDVYVHVGDQYFVTNEKVIRLAENVAIREHAKKSVASLSENGIESISVQQKGSEPLDINRDDVKSFDYQIEEQQLSDETRKMVLQIISLSFKEDNKWRVTDGGDTFSAKIDDMDFLNRIAKNEIAFAKGDWLVCNVREIQSTTAKGLKKESTIVKVLEYHPAARQLKLL